jgi:hypothetical protein
MCDANALDMKGECLSGSAAIVHMQIAMMQSA